MFPRENKFSRIVMYFECKIEVKPFLRWSHFIFGPAIWYAVKVAEAACELTLLIYLVAP